MICGHGHEQNFKYPYLRDSKIIQMPYPQAKAIDQIPAQCPTSPPCQLDIELFMILSYQWNEIHHCKIYGKQKWARLRPSWGRVGYNFSIAFFVVYFSSFSSLSQHIGQFFYRIRWSFLTGNTFFKIFTDTFKLKCLIHATKYSISQIPSGIFGAHQDPWAWVFFHLSKFHLNNNKPFKDCWCNHHAGCNKTKCLYHTTVMF